MEATDVEDPFPIQEIVDDGNNGESYRCTPDLIINPAIDNLRPFQLWISKQNLIVPMLVAVLSLVLSPFVCLVGMTLFSMPEKMFMKLFFSKSYVFNSSSERMSGMYTRAEPRKSIKWMRRVSPLCKVVILLIVWLVLNISVPRLAQVMFLGSPLWKWSLLALTLTGAYMECLIVLLLLSLIFRPWMVRRSLSFDFLFLSLIFVVSFPLYFALVLGSWLLYFSTERGLKHASTLHPKAFEYVTLTWVSLFVGSILFVWKHVFLLTYWLIKGIYSRFEARILFAWIKYCYLALLVEDYVPVRYCVIVSLQQSKPTNTSVLNYITSAKTATRFLCRGTHVLQRLADIVRSREGDGLPGVVKWCQDNITTTRNDDKCELDDLRDLFHSKEGREVAEFLYEMIREGCSSNEITFNDLKKWLVDAHKECVNLGRTLNDALVVAKSIGAFIWFIIVSVVVLLWLLITGIATTKVLVTIATPLLYFTFIFGETAKTFFQGVIFCVVIYPFQVGDRCIIDETELEVKSMSIFTTTFTKIGSKEKRMYPNSVLATKAIVNLGTQPDPNDVLQLTLDSSATVTDLDDLEAKINEFLTGLNQNGSYEKSHEVMIEDIGDKIKVTVHFTHVLSIDEATHNQCFQKKSIQRSKFLKEIKRFLEHKNIQQH